MHARRHNPNETPLPLSTHARRALDIMAGDLRRLAGGDAPRRGAPRLCPQEIPVQAAPERPRRR